MTRGAGQVLITSAGRRVRLVHFFQNALRSEGIVGHVIVGDSNPRWSAAAHIADEAIRMPYATDPQYERFLLDLVEEREIRLIIPTIDTELLQLARLRTVLERRNCFISVSDVALVEACRDKRISENWFRSLGLITPRVMDRAQLTFPCFVKPYDGSMSRGAQALLSQDSLSSELFADEKLIFMEWLSPEGYEEFTVDAYYCRHGLLRCLVPRKRIEVRGGEISKGVALKGPVYEYLRDKLTYVRGARGCLTFQFFASRADARCIAIELNPRFGGGYPLSFAAGADYPKWLIREYFLDQPIQFFADWKSGTAMVRYDAEVIFSLDGTE